jgi:uncharacterized protein (DUF2141 family)
VLVAGLLRSGGRNFRMAASTSPRSKAMSPKRPPIRFLPLVAVPFTVLALSCASLASHAAEGCTTVEVQNVQAQRGNLMVAAYLDEASFGDKPVASLELPAGETVMRFQLCGLSGEQVALTLYQDLDSDGKMGRNLLGMPTEPWGASGNPGMMGPTWSSARMPLNGQALLVRMSQ